MTTNNRSFSKLHLAASAAILIFFSVSGQATLLGVNQQNPDFAANNLNFITGTTATADIFRFDTIDLVEHSATGTYTVDLLLGDVSLFGTVTDFGWTNVGLLEGTVIGFGSDGVNSMDLLFSITGGVAADLFGGVGSKAGSIITISAGTVDTFINTPVPNAVWLLGTGLAGLFVIRKHKQVD